MLTADSSGLCAKLEQLHELGLNHYDFLPRNVVKDPDTGVLSIIDFALAEPRQCQGDCRELVDARELLRTRQVWEDLETKVGASLGRATSGPGGRFFSFSSSSSSFSSESDWSLTTSESGFA